MIGTKIILEDQSFIPPINISDNVIRPIVMMGFSSDKGTEDYVKIKGKDFFNQYGEISFSRHGQPLLQAANVIKSGGILYAKRIVAENSKLAGLAIISHIKKGEESEYKTTRKDPVTGEEKEIQYYWKKEQCEEPTEAKPNPEYVRDWRKRDKFEETEEIKTDQKYVLAKYTNVEVSYTIESMYPNGVDKDTNANNIRNIAEVVRQKYSAVENSFPMFVIGDVGRGVSRKRIKIEFEPTFSRTAESARYVLDIIEDDKRLESVTVSMDPDMVERRFNIFFDSVVNRSCEQVRCIGFEEEIKKFYEALSKETKMDINTIKACDIIDGRDFRGNFLEGFNVNKTHDGTATSVDLSRPEGHMLMDGSNGSFGDAPITTRSPYTVSLNDIDNNKISDYDRQMIKVFTGDYPEYNGDDIYNLDNNPIDVIVDADYHPDVKEAISELCSFREDVFYFRDMGTDVKSMYDIQAMDLLFKRSASYKTRYSATYHQSYDKYDPYTFKRITVTIGYDLARLVCMHFANGRSLVCAGQNNGWVIDDIIPGSINFTPKNVPKVKQVEQMEDLRINYGTYYQGTFSIVSEYTSQEPYTQLSFINNMLTVQELIKDIRVACPKSRYRFITGQDFEKYKEDVQLVIDKHRTRFHSIEIAYDMNTVYAANKIVYAVIRVAFKDFAQAEVFRIIAVPIATATIPE